VKVWTAHLRREDEPVLLRDAFSWGALLFGPLWFALQWAWLPAVLSLVGFVLIVGLAPDQVMGILLACFAWLHGLIGRDLCRWALVRRGFTEGHVLVARTETEALARLLAARPDLIGRFAHGLR
jgi:Protein of unknown function (DUF2628)